MFTMSECSKENILILNELGDIPCFASKSCKSLEAAAYASLCFESQKNSLRCAATRSFNFGGYKI